MRLKGHIPALLTFCPLYFHLETVVFLLKKTIFPKRRDDSALMGAHFIIIGGRVMGGGLPSPNTILNTEKENQCIYIYIYIHSARSIRNLLCSAWVNNFFKTRKIFLKSWVKKRIYYFVGWFRVFNFLVFHECFVRVHFV